MEVTPAQLLKGKEKVREKQRQRLARFQAIVDGPSGSGVSPTSSGSGRRVYVLSDLLQTPEPDLVVGGEEGDRSAFEGI